MGLILSHAGWAQVDTTIVLDESFGRGQQTPIVPEGRVWRIDEADGWRPGGDTGRYLLHSFATFDVGEGDTALFSADPGRSTQAVIARVTGGSGPSRIFGTLGSDIEGADLYFLNPRGIVFGRSARLDLRGSFLASTADTLRLFDEGGDVFDPFAGETALQVPSAEEFGFLGDASAIEVRGSQLSVRPGNTLSLIGGPLELTGRGDEASLGYLDTSGGRIDLAAVGGAGTVLRVRGPEPGLVVAEGVERADVHLLAGAIVNSSGVDPAVFCVLCSPDRGAGDVFVRARDLVVADSEIRAMTVSNEPAGNVDVGLSGDLSVRQTGDYTAGIFAGSGLDQDFREIGPGDPPPSLATSRPFPVDSPDVFVRARYLGSPFAPQPVSIHYVAHGASGDITVDAENVSLEAGGRLSTTSFFGGDPGSIRVDARGSVEIDGADAAGSASAIFSNGQGGSAAGDVTIDAEALLMRGGIIVTEARNAAGSPAGDGGNITVEVDRLEMRDDARIDSSTRGTGNGGNIRVTAHDSVSISGGEPEEPGSERRFSGITAIAQDAPDDPGGPVGRGGSIEIVSPTLTLEDRAEISARADETSRGGGDILVRTDRTVVSGGSRIATSAEGATPAGDIAIEAGSHLLVRESEVTSSVTEGTGSGGSIEVTAGGVVLDHGDILTTGEAGPGGDIAIHARAFLANPGSAVSARSELSVDGTVVIDSPVVDLDKDLTRSPAEYIDASSSLRASCAARARQQTGSFVLTSRNGSPRSPDEWLPGSEPLDDAESLLVADVAARGGPTKPASLAEASTLEGAGALRGGRLHDAEQSFERASDLFASSGDDRGEQRALGALADTQLAQGNYAAAASTLERALEFARGGKSDVAVARLRARLGNAYVALGRWPQAETELRGAVELAARSGDVPLAAQIENDLGNHFAARGNFSAALRSYEHAAKLASGAGEHNTAARAYANASRAALEARRPEEALVLLPAAATRAEQLGASRDAVFVLIHAARSYALLAEQSPVHRVEALLGADAALGRAVANADMLGELRELWVSYALGTEGALYALEHRYAEALFLTRNAIRAAESAAAPQSTYQWYWQEGRLLWAQGRANEALLAYRRALAILQELRPESQARYGSAAAQFRRAVAPVYVDFVDALLRSASLVPDAGDVRHLLIEARATMEQLKAAELRDYFRDDCVAEIEAQAVDLDQVSRDSRAAVVYPIPLPDRLELLVSLPSGVIRRTVSVGQEELARTTAVYRAGLLDRIHSSYEVPARKLYEWLVEPYADLLSRESVQTLVFVPDGSLRTVPMAGLYDGERFLVERYAVAVTSGLSLVAPAPLDPENARVLLAGVSEPVQGYPALPNTAREIQAIRDLYGGEVLLDSAFDTARFEAELESEVPSVVHVASHAVFTGDPTTSFLLTHDDRLTMDRLGAVVEPTRFRKRPIELLTLSACETAVGDERAALGLAGVAIRAGARSALGSLWAVQDEAAYELVVAFYTALKEPGVSKAEALRRAQEELIADRRFSHPFYWSPFLLISNWL